MNEIDEGPYSDLYETIMDIESKASELAWEFEEGGTVTANDDEVKQAINELKALVWKLDLQHEYAKLGVIRLHERNEEES